MKTSFLAAAALAALGTLTASAQAVQVTWYVTGHMQAALPGTPADLLALLPEGAAFNASFSFDSASASNPLYFTSSRTDFVTSSALAQTTLDIGDLHFESNGSSRIIEQADFNGESVTLNGGATTGPVPSNYSFGALDVLNFGHSGLGSASQADKYPWFSPFGPGGTFIMINPFALPDLSKSDAPASMDMFFYDPDNYPNYFHRIGTVEGLSFTPFAPVPEPAGWALLLGGGLLLGLRRRRDRPGTGACGQSVAWAPSTSSATARPASAPPTTTA
jgi:hypothetical protein